MSGSTTQQKWKQIERNLAQQQSFVQSITHKNQSKTKLQNDANIDNILSSSIQKAKQKMNYLQSKSSMHMSTSREKLSHSRQRKQKGNEESSAVAGAIKKLQEKITNLERQRESLIKQNKMIKNQLQNTKQQKESLKISYEESRRKSKNLEVSLVNDKNSIRQLQAKIKSLEKILNDKKLAKKQSELQEKLSTSQMLYRAQNQQMKSTLVDLQQKQKLLMSLENQRKQQQIRHLQQENKTKSIIREFELQVQNLEQKDKKKQSLIQKLKQQIKMLETQKNKQRAHPTEADLTQSHLYQSKLKNKNFLSPSPSHRQHYLEEQLEEQKERYDELFQAYKLLDEKNKREKVETKNFRNKFWELKDLTKQIVEKISGLPNGVTSQLRYLIVKLNKIEAFGPDYYASTPIKSSRKRSTVGNNATDRSYSKSRSKSKLKVLNFGSNNNSSRHQDLNCSKNSAKSNRSNRSMKSNRSKEKDNKQKNSKKSLKEKQVIISQKSIKSSDAKILLEQQIQDIRKRYKQLLKNQGSQNEDVGEDVRNQLNDLAVMLQQKSEQLTKLKKKK